MFKFNKLTKFSKYKLPKITTIINHNSNYYYSTSAEDIEKKFFGQLDDIFDTIKQEAEAFPIPEYKDPNFEDEEWNDAVNKVK